MMYEIIFKILNMSITATFIVLAVILLRLILQRAPKWISYALWSVVLFRLICPFSFSSAFSLLGGIGAPAAESGVVSYIPENIVHTEYPQIDLIIPDVNEAVNNSLPQGEEQLVADPLEAPTAIATFFWLLGIAIMLIYSVISYVLLKHRLSDATLLEGNVFETDAITSPFVCGLMKPRIYLPVGLPEIDRGYVLLHEHTHIRRRDYLIKPLAFLALSVHWFNPFMWLSFRLMSLDMEMSCDEQVARELDQEGKAGYSAALMRLAMKRPILSGSPLAFGESGVKGRVRNILNYKKPAFWVVAITAITVTAASVCMLANPVKTVELPDTASVLSIDMEQFNDIYALATAYAFDKCLYMNPASSYYPIGTTGQFYLCSPDNGFTVVDEETGKIQENYSLIDWQAKKVDTDEWNGMFMLTPLDISLYKSRIEYDIGSNYKLYQMDEQVWLGHFIGDTLWSLYKLKETDISTPGIVGRTGPNIPENGTLRLDSPDGTYRAEAYGTNKGITAAGLYPYEGLRVIRNSDETEMWNGDGYYSAEFLWNKDSRYVAVYGEARIYGKCFIVDADTGKVINLPDIDTVSAKLNAASQSSANRPDPYFKAVEWVNGTTIRVNYRWTSLEYKEVSGTYECNIISGDILANTSQINDSPG